MIRNYFKIAWRSLKRNKMSSFINIFGLALGLAVTMIIGLWIADELNYNNHFNGKNKIARIMQRQTVNGTTQSNETIPLALEFQLREKIDNAFTHIVMSSQTNNRFLKVGEKVIDTKGRFMQADAPTLLELKMLQGTKNDLKEINSIFISETTATTLFGNKNPIGAFITSNNEYTMEVRGVYKDIPSNNDFNDLHFIIPFKHLISSRFDYVKNEEANWDDNYFNLFVSLSENVHLSEINTRIESIKKDNDPLGDKFNPKIFVFPMNDWYLNNTFENGIQVGGRIDNIWLFGIIGLFILLLASINFMNLSTARSEKRALEVGIRKSIGSTRKQLIYQFLTESFLIVICAFIVSVFLVNLSLHSFNELANKEVLFPWLHTAFWLIAILFIVITSLLSGSYPAFYLSSFKPVKVIKGTFKTGKNPSSPRKTLVVIQFAVSIVLIIGTLIVKNQIDHSKKRTLGINTSQLIEIPTASQDFSGKYDIVRNAFLSSGAITSMSWGTSPSIQTWNHSSGFDWDGKPLDFDESFALMAISHDYIDAVGMKLIEGRSFSREFITDSNAVVINKTAVKYMGIKNPIGKYIRYTEPSPKEKPMQIVGVVDDVINESVYKPIVPQLYMFGRGYGGFYHIRLNPNQSTHTNLTKIEKVYATHFPDLPFTYNFVDERYALMFAAEEHIANLSGIFTILAIIISCLGLFGLASFVAEQRTKEIGIRKILGASVTHLWVQLSKDFIIPVIIALIIAAPIAYYFMNQWLQQFPYRINISYTVFMIAGIGALLITIITVSIQTIRTAKANPVKSLKTE